MRTAESSIGPSRVDGNGGFRFVAGIVLHFLKIVYQAVENAVFWIRARSADPKTQACRKCTGIERKPSVTV